MICYEYKGIAQLYQEFRQYMIHHKGLQALLCPVCRKGIGKYLWVGVRGFLGLSRLSGG